MRIVLGALLVVVAAAFSAVLASEGNGASAAPPVWAYGTDPNAVAHGHEAPVDKGVQHLSGSTLEFTEAQIQDHFGPADWYPGDHPDMPNVVAHGRKPAVWACALCHYPNGKEKPENAGIAGFPVSYFVEQVHEFRDRWRVE